MNARGALLAVLLLVDLALDRSPCVVSFLAVWTASAATWIAAGGPLW